MVRYRKKLVSLPIRLRNQKWDTYRFDGTQLWLRLPARVRLWPSTGAGRTALIWAVNESRLKRSLRALSTWSERESPLLLRNAIVERFLSNRQ